MRYRKAPDLLSSKKKAQIRAKNMKKKEWLNSYRVIKEGNKYRVYYRK